MKLQFDASQEYQLDAVQAVVDVFDGQPNSGDSIDPLLYREQDQQQFAVHDVRLGNLLQLSTLQLAENVHRIQAKNNLEPSEIKSILHDVKQGNLGVGDPLNTPELIEGNNFTVEMETGTGKTYVYLRTIHELYTQYGFKKFIIVVPSIAIKEGVLKNLEITKNHFASLYNNPPMDWHVWDPKKRGQARAFATNDTLQILLINIDSLAGVGRIIDQQSDYGTPIEYIRATNPVVVLDEPQNMETEVRKQAIQSLNPMCTLRYSATHKNPYNMVYKLDPVKAYDMGLVKKIEVDSVSSEDSYNDAYVYVEKIYHKNKSGIVAKIELDQDDARGLQRQSVEVTGGEDLQEITGREVYAGYIVDRISAEEQYVEFTNGKVFQVGQKNEQLQEDIVKYQIQRTVENHFEKELQLKERGIKVLSLFFIDKVANYRVYTEAGAGKGKFAKWFEEAYKAVQAKPKFAGVLEHDAESVHNGYFAQDKAGNWKDSRDTKGEGGKSKDDDGAYEIIMRDKERLLNVDEPLRFIFSHSALREGWDNPNVFQICTLNETNSTMKKRQEIGRGLRLPVNSEGERVRDDSVNILTVVANESYEDFAEQLQTELKDDAGVEFGKERIKDKRKRRKVRLKKEYQLDENFRELWKRIKHKTRYQVTFDTDELAEKAAHNLQEMVIKRPRITNTKVKVEISEAGVATTEIYSSGTNIDDSYSDLVVPDVLGKIQEHTRLTRETVFKILLNANKLKDILVNPQQVIDDTTQVINHVMQQFMVDGIKYERLDDEWDMRLFENDELEGYLENLVEVQNQEKTLYNYVIVDSETIERPFAKALEDREDVKFYFKLPSWFTIDTPLGSYNPDWAVVFEQDTKVYFVAETKGTSDINSESLKPSEKQKILCGKEHFAVLDEIEFIAPTNNFNDAITKLKKF